jgi:hypothetical protein
MSQQMDDQDREQFPDILAGLEKLAADIDRRRFPGKAWNPARLTARPPSRWAHPLAWLAGAAAVAAVAIGLWWPALRGPSVAPPSQEPADSLAWQVPQIDLSAAADVKLEIPCDEWPALADNGAGVEWTIPSVSFPSLEERKDEHDS